jgi:hypothetical protein
VARTCPIPEQTRLAASGCIAMQKIFDMKGGISSQIQRISDA